jgi:hypothetical protein
MSGGFALQPTSFIPVKVSATWSTATLAYADVKDAIEASFPVSLPMKTAVVFTIFEGEDDKDDKATLSIDTAGTATFSHDFDSAPVAGQVVFIVDMY